MKGEFVSYSVTIGQELTVPTDELLGRLNSPLYHNFYEEIGMDPPETVQTGWVNRPNYPQFILEVAPGEILFVKRTVPAETLKRPFPTDSFQRAILVSHILADEDIIVPAYLVKDKSKDEILVASKFEPQMISLRNWLKTVCRYDTPDQCGPEFDLRSRQFLTGLFTPQAIRDIHRLTTISMFFHSEDVHSGNIGLIFDQEGRIDRVKLFDHKLSFPCNTHPGFGCHYESSEAELLSGVRFTWNFGRPFPNLYSLPAVLSYYTDIIIDPDVVRAEYSDLCNQLRDQSERIQFILSGVEEPLRRSAEYQLYRHLSRQYPINTILSGSGDIQINGIRPVGKNIFETMRFVTDRLRQLRSLTREPLNSTPVKNFDVISRTTGKAYIEYLKRTGYDTSPFRVYTAQVLNQMAIALANLGLYHTEELEIGSELYTATTVAETHTGRKRILLLWPAIVLIADKLELMAAEGQLLTEQIDAAGLTETDAASLPEEIARKLNINSLKVFGSSDGVMIYELPED